MSWRRPVLKVSNLLLYLSMCFMVATGLLVKYRLPPGGRGGRGLSVLGMDRHEWGDYHFWVALGVIALSVLHLYLNWAWLKSAAAQRRLWPLLLGLGLGLAIIASIWLLPVERAYGPWVDSH